MRIERILQNVNFKQNFTPCETVPVISESRSALIVQIKFFPQAYQRYLEGHQGKKYMSYDF